MRYKKILFIIPKIFHSAKIAPNIGVGYLTEFLERHNIDCHVVDMNLGYNLSNLKETIEAFKPQLVGISMISTFRFNEIYSLIEKIKDDSNNIVIGGPHVTIFKKNVLNNSYADFAIKGEGELPLFELCSGKDLEYIQGLIYREGNEIIENDDSSFLNLYNLNFPRYEKFQLDKYNSKVIYINTSRGCPHQCIFCAHNKVSGTLNRHRDPRNVVEELNFWYKKGYSQFEFTDDNFALNKERVLELCRLVDKNNLDIIIDILNIRLDDVTEELLKQLKKIGVRSLYFGIESGNDKVLTRIKKGITLARSKQGLALSSELGFDTNLYFTLGHPGENFSAFKDSIRLALKYDIANAYFNNIVPFPGTELYNWIKSKNYFIIDPDIYMKFKNIGRFNTTPLFKTGEMGKLKKKICLIICLWIPVFIRFKRKMRNLASSLINQCAEKQNNFVFRLSGSLIEAIYEIILNVLGKNKLPAINGGWPTRLIPPYPEVPIIKKSEINAVLNTLRSEKLSLFSNNHVREFENRFADYTGSRYAIAVSSGTAALHCALIATGIGPGDEVIVPAISYISTAMVVLYQNAIPKFADVKLEDGNIDPMEVKRLISKKTKAIIPVHLCGVPCNMNELVNIASEYNLSLIEDACQAQGSLYNNRKVGSIGQVGCFSFFETKNMTTAEGGMIITNEANLANRLRLARHMGEEYLSGISTTEKLDYSEQVQYNSIGWNYRMNGLEAALGLAQLKRIDNLCSIRRKNATYLIEKLSNFNFIKLPEFDAKKKPCFNMLFLKFCGEKVNLSRDNFAKALTKENIPVTTPYQTILPFNNIFNGQEHFPNAREFYHSAIGFRVDPRINKKDIDDVIKSIKKVSNYSKTP